MADIEELNRQNDRRFDAAGVRWMGQNTNHLPLPPAVVAALHESIDRDEFRGYAPPLGFEALREGVVADLGLSDLGVRAMITDGGAAALYNVCQTFLRPGDHFITTEPGWKWPPLYARALGVTVTELDVYDPAMRYRLTGAQVAAAAAGGVRMIYLVDPNNPLGTCIEAEQMQRIVDVAREHDAIIVHDCTYQPFAEGHTLAARFHPAGTITIYSFSKWLGTAGLRIGAAIGPADLVARLAATPANSLGSSVVAQRAALAGLRVKAEWFPEVQRIQRRNQARIQAAVEGIPGLALPVYPSQGNYLVVECSEAGIAPEALAAALAEQGFIIRAGLYHTPRHGHRFVKISTTVPTAWVDELCERLPAVVAGLSRPRR